MGEFLQVRMKLFNQYTAILFVVSLAKNQKKLKVIRKELDPPPNNCPRSDY